MNKTCKVFLILALVFTACDNSEVDEEPVNFDEDFFIEKEEQNSVDELTSQAEKLDGQWISEPYLVQVEKTKSVFKSTKFDKQSLFGFTLKGKSLKSKSPMLNGYLVHEGGYDAALKFDSIKGKFVNNVAKTKEFDYFKNNFDLNLSGDKKLEFHFLKGNKIEKYKKVDADFDSELRKLLFEGNYSMTGNNSTISLKRNGEVKGFKDYVFYKIFYDFTEGIEFDAIEFYKSKNARNWSDGDIYKFEILKDSVKLQFLDADWENLNHKLSQEFLYLKKLN